MLPCERRAKLLRTSSEVEAYSERSYVDRALIKIGAARISYRCVYRFGSGED